MQITLKATALFRRSYNVTSYYLIGPPITVRDISLHELVTEIQLRDFEILEMVMMAVYDTVIMSSGTRVVRNVDHDYAVPY